ncbi:MAG TPA: crotonase/enoyl-CoA hydratase family protein [Burkholderiales bacterium]|jgi:DSF synthase|nr:crotonase/enoyl-CoA hydratase family protein [Burkholderiales bacterium]
MDMNIPQALLKVPASTGAEPAGEATEYFFSEQLSAFFDREQHAMWLRWSPIPRPNFNPDLLRDLGRYCRFITHTGGEVDCGGESAPVEYAILASKVPGVFNLGGDLSLFTRLIDNQDRDGLLGYGKACVDVLYRNYIGHELPITTISLIQGECLGGGFEAALSSDVLVAERQARFGFPEILFNLFPGMGAYSFLERKVGKRATENLITSGKMYSADDMLAMGVVDQVVDQGRGEAEIAGFIRSRSRSRNAMAGVAAARRRVHKLDYEELIGVVEVWVDTALNLSHRDLKLMQRLVSRQNDLTTTGVRQDEPGVAKHLH